MEENNNLFKSLMDAFPGSVVSFFVSKSRDKLEDYNMDGESQVARCRCCDRDMFFKHDNKTKTDFSCPQVDCDADYKISYSRRMLRESKKSNEELKFFLYYIRSRTEYKLIPTELIK